MAKWSALIFGVILAVARPAHAHPRGHHHHRHAACVQAAATFDPLALVSDDRAEAALASVLLLSWLGLLAGRSCIVPD